MVTLRWIRPDTDEEAKLVLTNAMYKKFLASYTPDGLRKLAAKCSGLPCTHDLCVFCVAYWEQDCVGCPLNQQLIDVWRSPVTFLTCDKIAPHHYGIRNARMLIAEGKESKEDLAILAAFHNLIQQAKGD